MHWIDLNCDVGEGVGNESLLFPFISSCSVACGGHAGDKASMIETVELALKHMVKIGAHPSYPDRDGFGRVSLHMEMDKLMVSISGQIRSLLQVLGDSQAALHHIKAHGALYNDLAKGGKLALAYLAAVEPFREMACLYAPCGSEFFDMAVSRGFRVWGEAFVDRAYEPDGSLVSRKKPGALLTSPAAVYQQVREMVLHCRVRSVEGSFWSLTPRTYCLHGDTPKAAEILTYLTEVLPRDSIHIRK